MSRNNLPDSDILLILWLQNKYMRTFPGTERSCNKQAQDGACSGCSWRDDVWWRRTLLHIIIINNVSTLGLGGLLLLGLVWPGLIIAFIIALNYSQTLADLSTTKALSSLSDPFEDIWLLLVPAGIPRGTSSSGLVRNGSTNCRLFVAKHAKC